MFCLFSPSLSDGGSLKGRPWNKREKHELKDEAAPEELEYHLAKGTIQISFFFCSEREEIFIFINQTSDDSKSLIAVWLSHCTELEIQSFIHF